MTYSVRILFVRLLFDMKNVVVELIPTKDYLDNAKIF